MNRKHTPGPWVIDDGDSDAVGVFQESDCDAICYLSPIAHFGEGLRGYDQDMANARLIAAAPCLLEAAKALEIELYGARYVSLEREESVYAATNVLRAAIKKAEAGS